MKALVLKKPGEATVETVPSPVAAPGELLLRVRMVDLSLVVTSKAFQFGQMPFALRASAAVLRRPNTMVG
jgi:NADPH:quinone reductase-like Zn-dependent oxidoreductase